MSTANGGRGTPVVLGLTQPQPESDSGGEGLPDHHLLGTALCNVKHERFEQERLKAEGRFRFTCADSELSHGEKLAILTEEVGEVAQQVLEQPDRRLAFDSSGSRTELRKELTQVAAVAVAWVESLFNEPAPTQPNQGEQVERIAGLFTIWACPLPECDEFETATYYGGRASLLCGHHEHPPAVRVEVMPVSEHEAEVGRLEQELENGGWVRLGAVETRIAHAEKGRDEAHQRAEKAEARLREIESKLESGYSFCHPESDCEGLRHASRAEALVREGIEEFERRAREARAVHRAGQRPDRELYTLHGVEGANRDAAHHLRSKLSSETGEVEEKDDWPAALYADGDPPEPSEPQEDWPEVELMRRVERHDDLMVPIKGTEEEMRRSDGWQLHRYVPASEPTGLSDKDRERLQDVDGPLLLAIREAVSTEAEGLGLRDEDGEAVWANHPMVEALGNAVSDAAQAALADQEGEDDE